MVHAVADSQIFSKKLQAPFTVLVVEDNSADAEMLLHALEQANLKTLDDHLDVEVRATAEGALQLLNERTVDLVLTDLILPAMDGLDLVSHLLELDRHLPVLVVTWMNTVDLAVEAMRRGAFDYVLKPLNPTDLGMRLHRAIRYSEILRRTSAFERMVRHDLETGSLVGVSAAFQRVLRQVREAAQVRSTVLITGETGTGKGLIARAIHEHSRERAKPFQVIDCATIPEGTIESELFGHVRGAFTGASTDKPGLIELAHGGTVFLDEIGELPLGLQAKLLRVIEENEVRPVGGTRAKRVDLRIIAATNQDLAEKVKQGAFRKDLYFRLAVVHIPVPPLRERTEDIPVIARHLLDRLGREMGKPRCYFDAAAIDALTAYPWPGNVRELRNVVERVVMLATSDKITRAQVEALLPGEQATTFLDDPYGDLTYMEAKRKAVTAFTRAFLRSKLARSQGTITKAAESSGISKQHFCMLMKRYLGESKGNED
ncbi:sigma-54-dependent transcriptional regulator [Nitrospira calida]|jgi:DNA-binding NtrC family response regulator